MKKSSTDRHGTKQKPKPTKPVKSGAAGKTAKTNKPSDWRTAALAEVREIIRKADPEIVEELKWAKASTPGGVPVFSRGGIICTGETYKSAVKLTFAKGASLQDPAGLFNSSMEGNVRRAIDLHEGEKVNEAALKDLVREAVAVNLQSKAKAKKKASGRRAG